MGRITTIDFHEDILFALERDDGVFVAVSPICESVGVSPQMQRKRIQADPILREGGIVAILPSGGGMQETFCLRLDLVNGWLFTIDVNRVKPELRERVLVYKRECFRVLFEHFHGKAQPVTGAGAQPLPGETAESYRERLEVVTEVRRIFGLPSAAALYIKLGLPLVPPMFHDPRQMDLLHGIVVATEARGE